MASISWLALAASFLSAGVGHAIVVLQNCQEDKTLLDQTFLLQTRTEVTIGRDSNALNPAAQSADNAEQDKAKHAVRDAPAEAMQEAPAEAVHEDEAVKVAPGRNADDAGKLTAEKSKWCTLQCGVGHQGELCAACLAQKKESEKALEATWLNEKIGDENQFQSWANVHDANKAQQDQFDTAAIQAHIAAKDQVDADLLNKWYVKNGQKQNIEAAWRR